MFLYFKTFLTNMSIQTRSSRVKAPAISDPDNVHVEVISTNDKTTPNLSGRVDFDGSFEGSHSNNNNNRNNNNNNNDDDDNNDDYFKTLEYINKSRFSYTAEDNNNNGLVHKCNSNRKCALCNNLKPTDEFYSSMTHRKYVSKSYDNNITLDCSTSNCIYLISCCRCDLQYVGETVQSLRDRFSGHRAGMKKPFADNKCRILSRHFGIGPCKNANYTVNIIEKLSGSGRDENNKPLPSVTSERQKKETKWMLTLQTVFPYGLNDRVGDEYMTEKDSRVIGNKFLPLKRSHDRPPYNANKNKHENSFLRHNFVKVLTRHLDHNLKDTGYFIRVSIKSFKKSFLKHISNDIYDFLSNKSDGFPNQQWYEMALDLIESRIYHATAAKKTKKSPKNIIKLKFINKGMDMININKIINDNTIIKTLPSEFNKTEKISTVYTLTKTIRSKIFNHKEFIKNLDTNKILKENNSIPCHCINSPFVDPKDRNMKNDFM